MDNSVSSIGATGPKYVNVRNRDVFLISFLYSRASIGFLCLIGLMSAVNTVLFIKQLGKSEPLCIFNNYLPYGSPEIRDTSMPIVYYCRFLEFSVPITFLQLILCILALSFGLNRKKLLRTVFEKLLEEVITKDEAFCVAMEPILHCRVPNASVHDIIEVVCETQRRHHLTLAANCTEHSTAYLIDRTWLLTVAIEYGFVILVGIYATVRGIFRFRQKRLRQNNGRHLIDDSNLQRPHSATLESQYHHGKLIRDITSEGNSAATL
uniref:Uncharacterized protein n=1 Tax=Panagrolaimus sp. ES5 TaxID=591445 RepID=A0AC34G5B7_9BILA